MKLMRNPVVVGVLSLLALGLVIQSLWPLLHGRPRGRTEASVPASVPLPAPAPAKPTGVPAAPTANSNTAVHLEQPNSTAPGASQIDLELVRQEAPRWAQGRRDPFQIRSTPTKPVYPRAMEVLSLSAIWRQTDSSLAVLNSHIYAAGDTILRFRIKSIESDRVWVQGPNGSEVVDFKITPAAGTNLQSYAIGTALNSTPGAQPAP